MTAPAMPPPEEHWEVQVLHSPTPNGSLADYWSQDVSGIHDAFPDNPDRPYFRDRDQAVKCARILLGNGWPAARLRHVTATYELP